MPGVRALLYGRPSRLVLRRELAGLLAPGATAGRIRLERAKFKPGRKLTGYYTVEVAHAGDRSIRPVEVTWAVGDEAGELTEAEIAAQGEALEAGVASPFASLGAGMPGAGMRVRVWPLDVQFPHLVRLADPDWAGRLLPDDGARRTARVRVTSVRYRPRQRHVLRYDVADGRFGGSVFAKLYRPGDAPRAGRVEEVLARRLERGGPGVVAAVSLPGTAADDVLLYPKVPGRPLSTRLWRGRPEAHLVGAGALLRLLHDGGSQADGTWAGDLVRHDVGEELRSIERAAEHLVPLLPSAAARVARVLDEAEALAGRLPAEQPGFAHGDFKSDHVWVAGDRLTLLDFDTCCVAEPGLDLGKFLADLSYWFALAERPGVGPAQRAFLEGYGHLPAERLARARLYEAVVLTKLAIRRLRRFDTHWERRTEALTSRAESLLAAVAVGAARRAATAPDSGAPA